MIHPAKINAMGLRVGPTITYPAPTCGCTMAAGMCGCFRSREAAAEFMVLTPEQNRIMFDLPAPRFEPNNRKTRRARAARRRR